MFSDQNEPLQSPFLFPLTRPAEMITTSRGRTLIRPMSMEADFLGSAKNQSLHFRVDLEIIKCIDLDYKD
jgi:hypothetical protein